MVFGKVSYKAYNLHHGFKAVKKIIAYRDLVNLIVGANKALSRMFRSFHFFFLQS